MIKSKLYVPIMNSNITIESRPVYAKFFQDCGVDTVFIAFDRETFFQKNQEALAHLKENICYFENLGLECGVWMQAFGFGSTERAHLICKDKYTKIRSVTGAEALDAFCPECEIFMTDYLDWVDSVAKTGTKMIMLDDDLCLSVRPGLGCFCDHHLKLLENELQEDLGSKDLPTLFFTGKPDKYRSTWLKVQKNSLLKFAERVRAKVNETDTNIRVGFCAGYTSWDIEGADAIEVTRVLAGNTRPFLRFTGAPYWVSGNVNRFRGQRLGSVNELARLQEKWCRESGIEVFAEADSYPRPRYTIPASLIECFDAAVTASGGMGDLKYLFEYYASPANEPGYVKHHLKNQKLREFLHTHFDDKTAVGVQVMEKMHKFEDMILPDTFAGEFELMNTAHSPAAAMLAPLGIPITYDTNPDIAIAFHNNIDLTDKLPKKLIIDITAAKLLSERDIDTGLRKAEPTAVPFFEHFGPDRTPLFFNPTADYYNCSLAEDVRVLSTFENKDGFFPSAYTYSNGTTEFLVFTFDAYTPPYNSNLFLAYGRQMQLIDFIGETFIYTKNEPGIYQICKRSKSDILPAETAVLFENISEDPLFDFEICLDQEYTSAEFCGAEGFLNGSKLKVTSEIAPYGMFAMVLR